MIEITESSLGIWFVSLPPQSFPDRDIPQEDWLGHLGRAVDGRLELTVRSRLYVDDAVFDSDDHKTWNTIRAKDPGLSASTMIRYIRSVVAELTSFTPNASTWELIRGERSLDEFINLLCQMPAVHHRVVPAVEDRP